MTNVGSFVAAALRVAAVTVAASCMAATSAHAATIVFNNDPGAGSQQGYLLGMDFIVNSPVTVTMLGAFDSGGDGFGGDVEVGIFNVNAPGAPLVSATLTGTANTLIGGSRFVSIPSFVLGPGTYSIVAVGFTGSNWSGNTYYGDGTSFDSAGGNLALVGGGGRWDYGVTTLQLPSPGPYSQADPVFQAGTFAVPDGGMTLTLLGGALAGLALLRRRRIQ